MSLTNKIMFFQPQPICNIEHITRAVVTREDDVTHSVSVYIQPDKFVTFSMEDRDACEFTLVLAGYHKLLTGEKIELKMPFLHQNRFFIMQVKS